MKDYSENKGYVQITIADEKKMLHFGMNAIKILNDELDTNLTQLGQEMTSNDSFRRFMALSDLVYAGMKSYDVQHGIEVDYNEATLLEDVLTMGDSEISKFQTATSYMLGLDYILRNPGKIKLDKSQQKKKTSTTSSENVS